jgi:proteasome lid subunit RPN8/RPN11/molybdopterin converting factor small subunit
MSPAPIVRVRLPAAFRSLAGGSPELRAEGRTLREVLGSVGRDHPELCERLLDAEGRLRRYVTFFLNGDDVRFAGGADAPVRDGDELAVVPALSGGRAAASDGEPVLDPCGETDDLDGALPALASLAEGSPREEVCGFVLASAGQLAEVVPLRNVAADRARGFAMDPGEVLSMLREGEGGRQSVKAIFHSHVEGGAELSPADRACLEAGGRPLWPGVEAWVIALGEGRVVEIRAHTWTGARYGERARRRGPFTAR